MEENYKRRNSILKKSVSTENDQENTNTATIRLKRRISFSGKKTVKEFQAGEDAATIWGTSYEESAENLGDSGGNVVDMKQKRIVLRSRRIVVPPQQPGKGANAKIRPALHPEADKENLVVFQMPPAPAEVTAQSSDMDISAFDTEMGSLSQREDDFNESRRLHTTQDYINNVSSLHQLAIENSVDITMFESEKLARNVKQDVSSSNLTKQAWSMSEDDWSDGGSPSISIMLTEEELQILRERKMNKLESKVRRGRDSLYINQSLVDESSGDNMQICEETKETQPSGTKRKTIIFKSGEDLDISLKSPLPKHHKSNDCAAVAKPPLKILRRGTIVFQPPRTSFMPKETTTAAETGSKNETIHFPTAIELEESSALAEEPTKAEGNAGTTNPGTGIGSKKRQTIVFSANNDMEQSFSGNEVPRKRQTILFSEHNNMEETLPLPSPPLSKTSGSQKRQTIYFTDKNDMEETLPLSEDIMKATINSNATVSSKQRQTIHFSEQNHMDESLDVDNQLQMAPKATNNSKKRQTILFSDQNDMEQTLPLCEEPKKPGNKPRLASITNEDLQVSGLQLFSEFEGESSRRGAESTLEETMALITATLDPGIEITLPLSANESPKPNVLFSFGSHSHRKVAPLTDGMDISISSTEKVPEPTNRKRQTIYDAQDILVESSATQYSKSSTVKEIVPKKTRQTIFHNEDIESSISNVQETPADSNQRSILQFFSKSATKSHFEPQTQPIKNRQTVFGQQEMDTSIGPLQASQTKAPSLSFIKKNENPEVKKSRQTIVPHDDIETSILGTDEVRKSFLKNESRPRNSRQTIFCQEDMETTICKDGTERPEEDLHKSKKYIETSTVQTPSELSIFKETMKNFSKSNHRHTIFGSQDMDQSLVAAQSQGDVLEETARTSSNLSKSNRQTIFASQNMDSSFVPFEESRAPLNFLKNAPLTQRQPEIEVKKTRQTIYCQQDMETTICKDETSRPEEVLHISKKNIETSTVQTPSDLSMFKESMKNASKSNRHTIFASQDMDQSLVAAQNQGDVLEDPAKSSYMSKSNRQTISCSQNIDSSTVPFEVSRGPLSFLKNATATQRQPEIEMKKTRQTIYCQQDMETSSVDMHLTLPAMSKVANDIVDDISPLSDTETEDIPTHPAKLKSRQTILFANHDLEESLIQRSGILEPVMPRKNIRQTVFSRPDMETSPVQPTSELSLFKETMKNVSKSNRHTIFANQDMETSLVATQSQGDVLEETAKTPSNLSKSNRQTIVASQNIDSSIVPCEVSREPLSFLKNATQREPEMEIKKTRQTIYCQQDMETTICKDETSRPEEVQHKSKKNIETSTVETTSEMSIFKETLKNASKSNRHTIFASHDMETSLAAAEPNRDSYSRVDVLEDTARTSKTNRQTIFASQNMDSSIVPLEESRAPLSFLKNAPLTQRQPEIEVKNTRQTIYCQQDMETTICQDETSRPEEVLHKSKKYIETSTVQTPLELSIFKETMKNVSKSNRHTIFASQDMDQSLVAAQNQGDVLEDTAKSSYMSKSNRQTISCSQNIDSSTVPFEVSRGPLSFLKNATATQRQPEIEMKKTRQTIYCQQDMETSSVDMHLTLPASSKIANDIVDDMSDTETEFARLAKTSTVDIPSHPAKLKSRQTIHFPNHDMEESRNDTFRVQRNDTLEPATPRKRIESRIPLPLKTPEGARRTPKPKSRRGTIYFREDAMDVDESVVCVEPDEPTATGTIEVTRFVREGHSYLPSFHDFEVKKHNEYGEDNAELQPESRFAGSRLFNSMHLSPPPPEEPRRRSDLENTAHNLEEFHKEFVRIDEIDKTHLTLVDSLDEEESNMAIPCADVTCNGVLDKEDTLKARANFKDVSRRQTSFVCKKCKCGAETNKTQNESTFIDFAGVLAPRKQIVVDFSLLKADPTTPTLNQVMDFWQRKRESGCFTSPENTSAEIEYFPEIPSFAFLRENRRKQLAEELRKNRIPGAYFPMNVKFPALVLNKMQSEQTNWKMDKAALSANVLQFTHTKIPTFSIRIRLSQKSEDKSGEVMFDQISIHDNPFFDRNAWSPFDCVIHNHLHQELPYHLNTWCSSPNDLFHFLQKVDETCNSVLLLAKELRLTLFDLVARVEFCDSKRDVCITKYKCYRVSSNNYKKMQFQILLKNINKLSYENICLPPLYEFSPAMQHLPQGIAFLKEFLTKPEEFLRKDS